MATLLEVSEKEEGIVTIWPLKTGTRNRLMGPNSDHP